jgi:hypothetical protein
VKVRSVTFNNRKKVFEVDVGNRSLSYPYSKSTPAPRSDDLVREVFVDKEIGSEGFGYVLESGREGTIHAEQVLEYNEDAEYLRDLLLYKLTLETQRRMDASPLSKREIARRLGTSAAQLYRLLDQTNYRKSIGQLVALLHVLDCEVEFVVRKRKSA